MRRYISTRTLFHTRAAQQQHDHFQHNQHAQILTTCVRRKSSSVVVNASVASSSSSSREDEEETYKKMLKRNDPFALPDFVQKCNDNNAKINVREVVKLLRESSIKHPRDLLRVNGEDLLETIGVDKKDLARALREKFGNLDRGGRERSAKRREEEGERGKENGERKRVQRRKGEVSRGD